MKAVCVCLSLVSLTFSSLCIIIIAQVLSAWLVSVGELVSTVCSYSAICLILAAATQYRLLNTPSLAFTYLSSPADSTTFILRGFRSVSTEWLELVLMATSLDIDDH